ncbi:biliverdin-producing heme oxygenase [Methylocella sp. CPCC 101449]|uniref:biliverdin-producing heme oxygenase n=1 Tax=Methylocella sp. CPCC 101449 TaxID=2987531 RepID=UPI0028900A33|nr:biliverdin-producing heme oxygenase [Methylocella sp. CPCC 101449]MDT2020843.1 biliverdin-producing heme oxygenase [Methylocella sp. CPCC 101449]
MLAEAATAVSHSHRGELRHQLRTATNDAHRHLDALFTQLDLRARTSYLSFLEASASALLPLEARLTQRGAAALLDDWPDRTRSEALMRDIRMLGGTVAPLSVRDDLDAAEMTGIIYVLEGSRLGARMLIKTVSASSDPALVSATAYLSHGVGQPLWQNFLSFLDRLTLTPKEIERAIVGARYAFGLFAAGASRR